MALTNEKIYREALEQIVRTAGDEQRREYSAAGHLNAICLARDAIADASAEPRDAPTESWHHDLCEFHGGGPCDCGGGASLNRT